MTDEQENKNNKKGKQIINSKMAEINPTISAITLNVKGLNHLTIYFRKVNCMIYELHIKKSVT